MIFAIAHCCLFLHDKSTYGLLVKSVRHCMNPFIYRNHLERENQRHLGLQAI